MKKFNLIHFKTLSGALIAFLALTLASTGCKKKASTGDAETAILKIGEVGSLTGSEATFGISTHQGIDLAIRQINAAGGIQGKKLQVITLDDQSKPDEAATAATKLVTQDRVIALLGEVASSRSIAMAPVAENAHVIMITPSSTNPKVTELGKHVFRVCFIDPFQGEVMAKFALESLQVKKVAVLRDIKSDYSTGLSEYFKAALKKGGGEISLEESYESGDIDFKSQLTAIRAKNPEAIFVPGYYTEVGLIARQARELGIKAPLLGGDGWDSPKLTEIGGKAIENSYFSNHYSNEDQSPRVQEFVSKFKESYHTLPDGMAAMGYDSVLILADAMKRAKSLQTPDILTALNATQNYPAVTGNITIDSKRNAIKSAVVLKVGENGIFKYQTTVNP